MGKGEKAAETSSSAFRPLLSASQGAKAKEVPETLCPNLRRPTVSRRPLPLHFSSYIDDSVQEVGETKPEANNLLIEMSQMFKVQSEMIKDLSNSHMQLQRDLKDALKLVSSLQTGTTPFSSSAVAATNPILAHLWIPDVRPAPEDRWKGGRDVRTFLKRFKTR